MITVIITDLWSVHLVHLCLTRCPCVCLSAVIAGGVIGFLFALFLILLLVYRMRKKDEGSYDLGERKPPISAYQKAPTKEFYA